MSTIYNFFAFLLLVRKTMPTVSKLVNCYYPGELVSYSGKTAFPSLALRMNPSGDPLGGELIGIMESKSNSVPSFKSHLPSGAMSINALGHRKATVIARAIRSSGEDARSLQVRDVYYLIRGRLRGYTKVCLLHGSFFETVKAEQLVREALDQAMADSLDEEGQVFSAKYLNLYSRILAQEFFSDRLRQVENVKIEFRVKVTAEVAKKANIFNSFYYPEIKDDTINLVIPRHSAADIAQRKRHLRQALSRAELSGGEETIITHPFNGDFYALSYAL